MIFRKEIIFFFLAFLLKSVTLFAQETYRITVSPDGTGDYATIQGAIDASKAFPDQRVTIFVRNGVYKEKVAVPACNTRLSIIGESVEKTIITWDDSFSRINRGRNSTFYTYTMLVDADDFYAENLTIENTAGPVGQAIALHVSGDRCAFRNCMIKGNQDTLYTDGLNARHYFEGCFIEGTTDFIFGAATVLFLKCTIKSKADSYITAASTPQGKPFGYVFLNCVITADEGVSKVYLGRPWRDFAKTVFIKCELGKHILPEGWSTWSGTSRDKTAFYAEYGNTGPGSDTSQRVAWSHQLTRRQASKYSIGEILSPVIPQERGIDQWINGRD